MALIAKLEIKQTYESNWRTIAVLTATKPSEINDGISEYISDAHYKVSNEEMFSSRVVIEFIG